MNNETQYEGEDLFGDLFATGRKKYQYTILTKIKNEVITFSSFCPPVELISYLNFHRNFALIGDDVGLWIRKKDVLLLKCISLDEAKQNEQEVIQGEMATA